MTLFDVMWRKILFSGITTVYMQKDKTSLKLMDKDKDGFYSFLTYKFASKLAYVALMKKQYLLSYIWSMPHIFQKHCN